MPERLTDEQVAWYAGTSRSAKWTADMAVHENIVTLAREVQAHRGAKSWEAKPWWRATTPSAAGSVSAAALGCRCDRPVLLAGVEPAT